MTNSWTNELGLGITVCDIQGNITYMNDKAKAIFAKHGESLIGNNLKDCHSAASWDKIMALMAENKSNSYTIEKNGIKKMIHQTPWYENSTLMGLVEFSIELPQEMPHYIRG
ncbi:MAG: PAS domain-containing protein [Prevotellaceae bacterium]|jgi:transcriptional regulator with PAS, ATPase and Fis domain|nr:PAS domain-containing protein [Prevotellaceae bacterium]